MKKARVIAFYLPQYYPIPENDEWWGKGFTEWVNVAKARPLFKGHYQPHIPADLGFYDLRMPEIREQQAQMAREAGIEGFCYWHYWFGDGRMLLERPFAEVLASGKPDFPFCLGWANESWSSRTWTNVKGKQSSSILMEQKYSQEDFKRHFEYVLPAFKDPRYIKVDNKPLFYIYYYQDIPDIRMFLDMWNQMAKQNGFDGIYFVARVSNISLKRVNSQGKKYYSPKIDLSNPGQYYNDALNMGFDAVNSVGWYRASVILGNRLGYLTSAFLSKFFNTGFLRKFDHEKIIENMYTPQDAQDNIFPTLLPNWDRSPRAGRQGVINYNATPQVFDKNIKLALDLVKDRPYEHRILFLRAWNEWGEGNHVEPDLKYGHGFLDALKNNLTE
ncbi:MAG: glycoside hydrolase family 99-like domain-containing protein [Bacteroidaceae bacterium]|nr:glycoside hydrolase family 99-like domain-containing protein [Bacteroidaceae bacterium]